VTQERKTEIIVMLIATGILAIITLLIILTGYSDIKEVTL
jgi:hypothetical protein